jgi:hypothetical protein
MNQWRVFHYDGTQWSSSPSSTSGSMMDIWGSSTNDVFITSQNFYNGATYLHFNGAGWTESNARAPVSYSGVWSNPDGDVIVVGADGLIEQITRDGARVISRRMESGTTSDLVSVWGTIEELSGTTTNRLVAVGADGTVVFSDGQGWAPMQSGTDAGLNAVWGRLSNFIAVGNAGTILRYNGTQWSTMDSGVTADLFAVWGSSMQDVYAVGGNGTILRWNGTQWRTMLSQTTNDLRTVWGSNANSVLAAGTGGVILFSDGKTGWHHSSLESSFDISTDFTSMWGPSGHLVFAGTTAGIYRFDRSNNFEPKLQSPYVVTAGHSIQASAVAVTTSGETLIYYP